MSYGPNGQGGSRTISVLSGGEGSFHVSSKRDIEA